MKNKKNDKIKIKLDSLMKEVGQNIDAIERLVQMNLPQKGSSSYECSHCDVMNAINELQRVIDSLEVADLIQSEDWEIENHRNGFVVSDHLVY